MNRYVIRFTVAYVILTVVLACLAELLNLKFDGSLIAGAVMASSFFAGAAFARDHARPPTDEERTSFARRALMATWLVTLVLAAIVIAIWIAPAEILSFARSFMSGSVLALAIGALLLVSAIYYFAIRWSFGFYAKIAAGRRT
jgi:polyferredoxin